LKDFVRRVEADPELQVALAACDGPEGIVQIAASVGLVISRDDLRSVSRELSAPYWPWAAKGHQWRRAFFTA
jgi:predicted ribosomally synthesized peptide with nif11-like leader